MKTLSALILCLTLLLTACSEPASFKSTDISGANWGQDFALIDHNGISRRLADFRGKAVLVFFGYTQCPDVCPTTLASVRAILRLELPAGKPVKLAPGGYHVMLLDLKQVL